MEVASGIKAEPARPWRLLHDFAGCLALFYYIVDVRRRRAWRQPFIWIGSNAITLYLSAQIVNFQTLAARLAGGDVKQFLDVRMGEGAGSVCMALVGLGLMVGLARFLYKQGIFIRVWLGSKRRR